MSEYILKHGCEIPMFTRILKELFGYKTGGFFVEFGVGGCKNTGSNTADLADLGWQGVYVEPNHDHYLECVDRHKNNNVKVFECAAGNSYEDLTLEGDTTHSEVFEAFDKLGWYPPRGDKPGTLMPPATVKQMPVQDIFIQANVPNKFDLWSIDVEGAELTILKSTNFTKWRPTLIILETRHRDPHFINSFPNLVNNSVECITLLQNSGYRVVLEDHQNALLVSDPIGGAVFK